MFLETRVLLCFLMAPMSDAFIASCSRAVVRTIMRKRGNDTAVQFGLERSVNASVAKDVIGTVILSCQPDDILHIPKVSYEVVRACCFHRIASPTSVVLASGIALCVASVCRSSG